MCGILFIDQKKNSFSIEQFQKALFSQSWRGPDNTDFRTYKNNKILFGHNRLSIVDENIRSNQPYEIENGRYSIIFNGEIYNYLELKKDLNLTTKTSSDTEIILRGYIKLGKKILDYLDGMFSFIIYDNLINKWFAARDHFGIKPLYFFKNKHLTVIGSESGVIAKLLSLSSDMESIQDWRVFRRPAPGYTFFKNLKEFLPGHYLSSDDSSLRSYWSIRDLKFSKFYQEEFEDTLKKSIYSHQIGDMAPVSLLSGGLDSSIITSYANRVNTSYSVGLYRNNEFKSAEKISKKIGKQLVKIKVTKEELISSWKKLTDIRQEPLSVPNEGLIYLVCKKMKKKEKVVLTGEGADELLFGYDRIYRWATITKKLNVNKFLEFYSYSDKYYPSSRMIEYIIKTSENKNVIQFIEDFFIDFHLTGLLRRMDFASMAASKESRVPFVSKKIIKLLYRQPSNIKIDTEYSKKPLRKIIKNIELDFILSRKKIGFSSSLSNKINRFEEYENFQKIVLGELNWL